uniref:Uncharacterized protein n=1 Tax=Peronospora matthiolae TaxID=2874970 RepID=A0AAV1UPT2_9STRA
MKIARKIRVSTAVREIIANDAKMDRISEKALSATRWYSFGITVRQIRGLETATSLIVPDEFMRPVHHLQALIETDVVSSGQIHAS